MSRPPNTDPFPMSQGHLARLQDGLDFINTDHLTGAHRHPRVHREDAHDHLDSPGAALDWLSDHDLLHHEAKDQLLERYRVSTRQGVDMLERLRRLRDAMRGLVESAARNRGPDAAHLAELNRAMRTHYVYELTPAADGVSLDHRHVGDPVDGAMARLAESVARELIQGNPERLRVCANDDCRWVFSDSSRTGQRKWCDMATCGNRAKVARHRARRRVAVL